MKWTVIIIACLSLSTIGCKKGNQAISKPNDVNSKSAENVIGSNAPMPKKVVAATGEAKELLLSLKRVHFSFDSSALTDAGRQGLNEAAKKLTDLSEVTLFVDGHTDERGTTEYNMALGEKRAETVTDYLERLGIAGNRLRNVSFGKESPLSKGRSAIDMAENRRVDFRIMHGDVEFVLDESPLIGDFGQTI